VKRSGFRGSFWPSPIQEALLGVALGPTEAAKTAWEAEQPIDIGALETGSFGLLPLLYDRLSQVAPNTEALPRLLGTYRNAWYRNQLLLDRLPALVDALHARSVEPVVVGGAAVATRWYGRLGLRPVPELELMVASGAEDATREAAQSAGWRPGGTSRFVARFVDASGRVLVVHQAPPSANASDVGRTHAALLEAARLEVISGASVLVLDAVDELLRACTLGARVYLPPSVQWLPDTAMLLAAPDRPTIDAVVARAQAFRVVVPLRETVRYLAEVVGVTGLDAYLDGLRLNPAARRDEIAHRLGGAGQGRLGGLPQIVEAHLRSNLDEPLRVLVARFPRHVQETWEVDELREVPRIALNKVKRAVRARRQGALSPPSPDASPGSARNRSVSS
jgi:hypothetical protein